MKVIVAGFPKTGTKSMNAALTALGYNVYDILENCVLLCEEYTKIFQDGWTTADFKRMYENVDAVVDVPAFYFWEEIHKAFPDAKIILTVRENEDVWFQSFKHQLKISDTNIIFRLLENLAPTTRRIAAGVVYPIRELMPVPGYNHIYPGSCFYRQDMLWNYADGVADENKSERVFDETENAPADKLLVFNCSDGWRPLCKFLGVPTRNEPFPHKNIKGSSANELLATHPLAQQLKTELYLTCAAVVIVVAVGFYLMRFLGYGIFGQWSG